MKFVSTCSNEYHNTFDVEHKVYEKYQMIIHKDAPEECTAKQYKRFLVDTPIEVIELTLN